MSEKEKPKSDIQADVKDVIRSETRRGKRPIDLEQRKRRRDAEKALRDGSEETFKNSMRALGFEDGSEKFEVALKIWRAHRQS